MPGIVLIKVRLHCVSALQVARLTSNKVGYTLHHRSVLRDRYKRFEGPFCPVLFVHFFCDCVSFEIFPQKMQFRLLNRELLSSAKSTVRIAMAFLLAVHKKLQNVS